jgi:hypothetical protein
MQEVMAAHHAKMEAAHEEMMAKLNAQHETKCNPEQRIGRSLRCRSGNWQSAE